MCFYAILIYNLNIKGSIVYVSQSGCYAMELKIFPLAETGHVTTIAASYWSIEFHLKCQQNLFYPETFFCSTKTLVLLKQNIFLNPNNFFYPSPQAKK